MKRNFILIIGAFLLLPIFVSAVNIEYVRTPAGYTITNPVSFEVDKVLEYKPLAHSWQIDLMDKDFNEILSPCYLVDNQTWTDDFPLNEYIFTQWLAYDDYDCIGEGTIWFGYLEYNDEEPIFEIVEPAENFFLVLNPEDITAALAYTAGLFADIKLLLLLVIGVPIGFYIIKRAITLTSKRE